MTLYINSPQWFAGIDSAFELISLIVAFIVAAYGYKIYKLSKEKKYLYFSSSFFLVALSLIFKIISEFVIYEKELVQQQIGPWIVTRTIIEPVTEVHVYSHTIFRLLSLFAFFILLVVTLEKKDKPTIILLTYFMILVTFVSIYAHILFYITQMLLIALLVYHFHQNYLKHKTRQALFVTLAFLGMFVSNIVLTFMMYDPDIYVIGEVLQLIGFGLLLYAFILVKKNDKPKKQA
jgi:D-alanyl-lipoteichoic acid acyltransferase DltB (MBOAT superfamily)